MDERLKRIEHVVRTEARFRDFYDSVNTSTNCVVLEAIILLLTGEKKEAIVAKLKDARGVLTKILKVEQAQHEKEQKDAKEHS